MNGLRERCARWLGEGKRVSLAVIERTEGSAPFAAGTKMAFSDAGDVYGSLSSGCVDGAVTAMAQQVFADGCDRDCWFDSRDGLAAASLMCGGSMYVRVFMYSEAREAEEDTPVLHFFLAGANAYAQALAQLASSCGYAVTVADPRPAFTKEAAFGEARVVCAWPDAALRAFNADRDLVVLMLAHDERYDAALLQTALRSEACFVGAIGNRKTQLKRIERLIYNGCSHDEVARLHAPLGLDLGGRTAHETAIAILAEVLAVRFGGSGVPLRQRHGPIHHPCRTSATRPPSRFGSASAPGHHEAF